MIGVILMLVIVLSGFCYYRVGSAAGTHATVWRSEGLQPWH
jgi:hypothetical protein